MIDRKQGNSSEDQPLQSIGEWDDFVSERVYPFPDAKKQEEFRDYARESNPSIAEFYRTNHRLQTYEFVQRKRTDWLPLRRCKMSPNQALEFLNTLVDDSDPDLDLDQLQHLLQTSEAIRQGDLPDWFVLAGFLHDLGKVLCLFGEPQWAVVGDTFPVGCQFRECIVYSEYFAENPDSANPQLNTPLGVYKEGCGLDRLLMSWGHDEYLYHVLKEFLPVPALYMIRYHSFYAWHREGAYDEFCNELDREMLPWVKQFNSYDLYSKRDEAISWQELRPFYQSLLTKYLPEELCF